MAKYLALLAAAGTGAEALRAPQRSVETCVADISRIFSNASMAADARAVLLDYTENYCPALDVQVNNGALPAMCFHSGYYLL